MTPDNLLGKKIGVIDIETTGFFNKGGIIVEVGIVELDVTTGQIKDRFDSVVKEPGLNANHRNAWIFENSSLTRAEVRDAPFLHDLLARIQVIVDSFDYVTAYNKAFDFQFLRDRGLVINREVTCPMLAATDILKIPSPSRYRGGYKWPKAQEAYDYFFPDLPFTEEHRGLSDARIEAMILTKLIDKGVIEPE